MSSPPPPAMRVVAGAAVEHVGARVAGQHVGAVAADDRLVVGGHGVVLVGLALLAERQRGEVDGDRRDAAGVADGVAAAVARQQVGAGAAVEDVVAVAAGDALVAGAAGQRVVAGAAGEQAGLVDVDRHAVVAVAEVDGEGRHEPGGAAGLVRGDLDAGGGGGGDGRAAVDEGDGAGGAGADLEVVRLAGVRRCSGRSRRPRSVPGASVAACEAAGAAATAAG